MEVNRENDSTEKESEKYKDPCDTVRINYAGIHDFKYKDLHEEKELPLIARRQAVDGWMG